MLAENLKSLRTKHKKTQQQVADMLGITRQGYGKYENNLGEPDNATLAMLADYFEVTTDYLLGRENKKLSTNALDKEYEEFESFISDPSNRIHFREMAESPEEMREKLWEYWDLLKKARDN